MSRKSPKKTPSRAKSQKAGVAAKPTPARKPAAKNATRKRAPAEDKITKATTDRTKGASNKVAKAKATKVAAAKPARTSRMSAKPNTVDRLTEGQIAPNFSSTRDDGQRVSLADFAGRKLVIFFYPRADTPGCTREAIDFTQLAGAFDTADAAVLGVSADDLKAQVKFRDKHKLGIPLVADVDRELIEAYGVWGEKSMYGKSFLGILRTTVLIDRSGKIARIWRNVKVDGHAAEVLEAAKAL